MGCGMGVVKYLLFIFNLIFALSGLALLVMGVLKLNEINVYNNVADFLGTNVQGPPIGFIVVGSIVFVIAFFGCCGAVRESHCMVVTFAVFLLVIFIAEIAVGVIAFLHKDDLASQAEENMFKVFNNYTTSIDARGTFDKIQTDLHCCGVESPGDYLSLFKNNSVPASCCIKNEGFMCTQSQGAPAVWQDGCFKELKEFVKHSSIVYGAVACGIALIELIGIIFALCLANSIKNEARRMGRA